MSLLPIFLNLTNRQCLFVGAGSVALDKINSLLKTELRLRVIAPEARPEIQALAREQKLEWIARRFTAADLDRNFIVIAATDDASVNASVYQGCVKRNILCNSVDDIPNCDFFFGSVIARGALQIAISTSGESPAVAQRLRKEIDAQLPDDLGGWLQHLGQLRRDVLAAHPPGEERKALLHQLAVRSICGSSSCPSRQIALPAQLRNRGSVALVGAGPGDPDLLTVKALRVIQSAEVILHDDLVPQQVLRLASSAAKIVNVGKRCGVKIITQEEINALMIAHARADRSVVRLKSGDPVIFGRASEEITALNEAGIDFEIVPGITAASAGAAALRRSLTDRDSASNVTFSSGHHAQSHNRSSLPEIEDTTRVVYMPGRDLHLLAQEWLEQGLPSDFPCAVVSHAAQPDQEVLHTTLAELGQLPGIPAPSLLIAGWVVRNTAAAAGSAAVDIQLSA